VHDRLAGRLGHGQQAAVVGRLRGHLLGHDQRMFGIHSGLHVIGWRRRMAMAYAHQVRLRLRMPVQLLQCRRHRGRINEHFIPHRLAQAAQITLHCLALVHTASAAGGLELGTIDGYPLTRTRPTERAKPTSAAPAR